MKITVKDCLELSVFKQSVLKAGQQGVENRVSAISFLEFDGAGHWQRNRLKCEELVFCSNFFDQSKELQQQVLGYLADTGSAAIVLFHSDETEPDLDGDVQGFCNEIRLPVISVPFAAGVTYADVIDEVMERVHYGDNFGNRLISNTIFHLLNFEKHHNFQSAAREAAINNNFQMVILSEEFNPIFSVETRHRATIADAIRAGIEKDVNKSTVYTKIDINGALTYWGPVIINGEKHYMFIVDNEDSYSPGEITKLAEILEIAMNMWKYSPVKDAKAELIQALRRGNKSLAYSLKDEAEVSGDEIISVFCVSGMEKDDCLKKITSFEKTSGLEVLKIHEDEEIYGMILEKGRSRVKIPCIELYQEIQEAGAAVVFHVTGVAGIEGSADAYQLINEAWPFIQHIFPHQNLFSKYELALASNCINISIKSDSVKKNYMDLLAAFKTAGDSKWKQLLETLEIFVLDAGMNTSKTAKLMKIHSNTVQYRLKRIKELLGADLMGTTIMPGLTVSLAIERIEKITKMIE